MESFGRCGQNGEELLQQVETSVVEEERVEKTRKGISWRTSSKWFRHSAGDHIETGPTTAANPAEGTVNFRTQGTMEYSSRKLTAAATSGPGRK